MFRNARRIAAVALIAAALPVASASAALPVASPEPEPTYLKVTMKDLLITSATPEPAAANIYLKLTDVNIQATAMLLPAVQKVREAAAR